MSNTSLAAQGFRTTDSGSPGGRKMSRILSGDLIQVERWGIPSAQVRFAYTTGRVRVLEWAAYHEGRAVVGVLAGNEDLTVPQPEIPRGLPRRVPLASRIAAKEDEVARYDLDYGSLRDGSMAWHELRPVMTWGESLSESEKQTAAASEALTAWEIAIGELDALRAQQAGTTEHSGGRAA